MCRFSLFKNMKCYCNECVFFKYIASDGFGYCELWQESDVNSQDEACVEYQERPSND